MHDPAIWAICAAAIAGILIPFRRIGEWVWPAAGSLVLVLGGLLSPSRALHAVATGLDVYLFLAGMMLLAEVARREGLFDWLAGVAVRAAHGSRARLFALVYGVGVAVTTVLSNDATAVVLTPAVAAAVRAAQVDEPLPYLYACALVANAASFVLPISNPANLVIYGRALPPLERWMTTFALPALLSIVTTYALLFAVMRVRLRGTVAAELDITPLRTGGRFALIAIVVTALVLVTASALGLALGAVTFACGALVVAVLTFVVEPRESRDGGGFAALVQIVRGPSWTVLLLVAGLFVLVSAIETTGTLLALRQAVNGFAHQNLWVGALAVAAIAAVASNVTNNLPAGLLAGASVATLHGHESIRSAVALGIDLGPNLSVTGSLATILWLIALRRERIDVSRIAFLRVGVIVMPAALALAVAALVFVPHA
ncbi:MAG: SLC13 family permease [Candidatus Eremiobacteraeota bacterium]|nr:SLC13 family permease [Candidatus Eremiobacteraeota bacterium]